MTNELFDLVNNSEDEWGKISEYGKAIIDISRSPVATEMLIDALHTAVAKHQKYWDIIEDSQEFKDNYAGDRLKLLQDYDAIKALKTQSQKLNM